MTDSCPSCCRRGVTPSAERLSGGELLNAYRCPACGHVWLTARALAAYEITNDTLPRRGAAIEAAGQTALDTP